MMQQVRKLLYVFLQTILSGVYAAFLASYPFPAIAYSGLSIGPELLLYVAGVICTTAAILLLMVYAVHEAKGLYASLSFSAACKHAGCAVLLLLCMLPALLLFSILEGLYFWLIAPFFFNAFQPDSGLSSFFGLLLAIFPALATLFVLPFALHPFFSLLIHPRPIREAFRHALQTWKTMYKPLLFWSTAVIAIQTVISLIGSVMPHGFGEIMPIISSAVLQTLLFYKMLARYARENSAAE